MPLEAGLTRTERYLNRLGRLSFLSLWGHANLFRSPSKELADYVVICHNIVILFSDKEVAFNEEIPIETAWPRWYNRAVLKSVAQLNRASNWVMSQPHRIYKDVNCKDRVELLDNIGTPLEVYRIAIANGAAGACLRHFEGGSGSLVVSSYDEGQTPDPFCTGNPGSSAGFVHVFDEAHLHIVFRELDTIADFTDYLRKRQELIEKKRLLYAASEEDLLALYLKDVNEDGEHDFVFESGKSLGDDDKIIVQEGSYASFRSAGAYKRKKLADRKSYLWDRLIEKFAGHLTAGTLADVPEGLGFDGKGGGAELSLRYMALEPRVQRRAHSEAILTAFDVIKRRGNRFFRAMLPPESEGGETAFCLLLLKRSAMHDGATYDEYRQYRATTLAAYMEGLLERNRHLRRVIGIATEGDLSKGASEDLVYHEPPEWTEETLKACREREDILEIFRGEMSQQPYSAREYPETERGLRGKFSEIPYRFFEPQQEPSPRLSGNRSQRRAAKARSRRSPRT